MAKGERLMYAILSALEEELQVFVGKSEIIRTDIWNDHKIRIVKFAGRDVVITNTGVGKAQAALVSGHVIDVYQPEALFYTGIAGALTDYLSIGDVIIARDCVQWDFDAAALGFEPGEVPAGSTWKSSVKHSDKNIRFIMSDKKLLKAAEGWKWDDQKVIYGRILTGDTFLTSRGRSRIASLIKELEGDAVEMEGAGAGVAAFVNNVPFFLARVISDTTDGKKPKRFKQFLKEASIKMAELIEHILRSDSA